MFFRQSPFVSPNGSFKGPYKPVLKLMHPLKLRNSYPPYQAFKYRKMPPCNRTTDKLPPLTNQIRLISIITYTTRCTNMIGQEESRATTSTPLTNKHTAQTPWPADDELSSISSPCSSKSSCGTKMYALSFIIPAATVAAIYLPDAMKTGNCAMATIPAVLAGTTAFGLYRLAKFIKHRK